MPPPRTKPAPESKPEPKLDAVGKPIPAHLVELFDRVQEMKEIWTALSTVKSTITAAREAGDVLYGELDLQFAVAGIEQAYHAIKSSAPYAVCPWCAGIIAKECRGCGGRGVIGKFRYENGVPREMKK